MATPDETEHALQQRLERLQAAMGPRAVARASRHSERAERRSRPASAVTALAMSVAFVAWGIATNNNGLLIAALVFLIIGATRALQFLTPSKAAIATQPHIGMGATIASGAVVEPGAVVEMGADVMTGAVVRRGAVVRMGASVHANAVIEAGAVVGWGCDIEENAVVGASAVVGAGATVQRGARVPANMRLLPGVTFASTGQPSAASLPTAAAAGDPRQRRIEAAASRIEAELEQVPPAFREHLGATAQTATALRQTCLELLERERTLRAAASPEGVTFLDHERAELEKRVAAATDAQVQNSLRSALAAIDSQKQQLLGLRTQADRLDAELTRLQWTLDGMATQLVRLRTAGVSAGVATGSMPSAEVLESVHKLHSEIDAIAEALEEINRTDASRMQPISPLPSDGEAASSPVDQRTGLR